MLTKLTGGRVIDPEHGINDVVRDIYIRDGRIVDVPSDGKIDEEIDVRGKIIMSGAIDMHTHIGGGKVNIARTMLPEDHAESLIERTELMRSGCGHAAPSTLTTGYRYAEMGYTAGFEPLCCLSMPVRPIWKCMTPPLLIKAAMRCWAVMIFCSE